jgi:Uma2 family endonuclease
MVQYDIWMGLCMCFGGIPIRKISNMLAEKNVMTFPNHLPTTAPVDKIPGPDQGHWTYQDYANLPDDGKRYEVVDGVLFMTPSPGNEHQNAVGEIFAYLRESIRLQGLGKVILSPFDVELSPNQVVQPDIIVVLNENKQKITHSRIVGAPDLVVEVVSPGSVGYDRREKQNIYAQAGVPEYWLVDPISQNVELLLLETEAYRSQGIFQGQAILPSRIVPQLSVPIERFFQP